MWIVRLALRRPYTFVVMSVLIVIMSLLAIVRTPKDIFPDINIPVISVIWTYNGLSTQEFVSLSSNKVQLASVVVGRDLGKTIELASGLPAGTRFVTNPNDTLRDGATVTAAPDAAAK